MQLMETVKTDEQTDLDPETLWQAVEKRNRDYDGRFFAADLPFNSKLSKSSDDLAFIGTVSLETRKQIGTRTSLSLWTDYEYISSVPSMRYNNGSGQPTRISDDDVFASRTMLRLNIGFGPAQLYQEPLK